MHVDGETIGQYEIIRRLGSGGMATVYLARHTRLERLVAIKLMHEAFEQNTTFLERFEREAQIVAGLEHPHIIPVHDYSDHLGKPYLIMKYIEGRSLKQILQREPLLEFDTIVGILRPIADALDYAHQQGILHRDIKPSNIMLDEHNTPYLADFGLARIAMAGESTLSQDSILGTPQYLSPEQAKGTPDIDGRADLYSLGIVIYQIIVGEVPFSADTPFAVVHDHIYTPVPDPSAVNPDVPPALADVLVKMLAKDPKSRYSTGAAMFDALEKAAQRSGFTKVDPAHAAAAAESIALQREQLRAQYASTPRLDLEGPYNNNATIIDSRSLVTDYRYPFSWVWTVGGLIMFIISMMGLGAVNANIDQQTASRRAAMQATHYILNQENTLADLPRFTAAEAQRILDTNPSDSLTYIGLTLAFWEADQLANATQSADAGRANAPNAVEYDLMLAHLANTQNRGVLAVQYYLRAFTASEQLDVDQAAVVRTIVGRAVYELATADDPSLPLSGIRALTERERPRALLTSSPMGYMALASIALKFDEPELAARALDTLDNLNDYEAEYQLVLGDYHAYLDDEVAARDAWKAAVDEEDAPLWIIEQVRAEIAALDPQ